MNAAQQFILETLERTLGPEVRAEVQAGWDRANLGAEADTLPRREELQRLAAWRFSVVPARRMVAIQRLYRLGLSLSMERVHDEPADLRELLQ